MELDKKDHHILKILDWKARATIKEICKLTKIKRDVVAYRINKLENLKIIEGYYTLVNTSALGYMTFRIYFELVDVNRLLMQRIVTYFDKKFNAGQIFTLDGPYQLGIICWESSIYNLENKLKKFKELFGDNINTEFMSVITSLNHYPRKIFERKQDIIQMKKEEVQPIKNSDLRILIELSKNARSTTTELAKTLNIPQRTIAYKIKKLEKNKIILGYRAKINTQKIGYENYFLEIYTHRNQDIKEIEMYSRLHKNVIYSVSVYPGANIELETEFQSKKELLDFIDDLKDNYKSIKSIKYWSTLSYEKTDYLSQAPSKEVIIFSEEKK